MNTYPTTAEQLYLEQKMRDDNNPGCIAALRESKDKQCKFTPISLSLQQKIDESEKKYKEQQIAGYESRRYDFPEYQWCMIQDGKKYLRSSKNFNVYDYSQSSVIVGTWNELEQRIEFIGDLTKKIKELKKIC